MKNMEKKFVTPEIANKLKELGYNEQCLGYYKSNGSFTFFADLEHCNTNSEFGFYSTAPLWQDCLEYLDEIHNKDINIRKGINPSNYYPEIDNVSYKYEPKMWFNSRYEAREHAVLKAIEEIENLSKK